MKEKKGRTVSKETNTDEMFELAMSEIPEVREKTPLVL
jgi:hypothetical protein